MDGEFREYGKEMVDLIADYWQTLRQRNPIPDVDPGYIWKCLPSNAPNNAQPWNEIFKDVDNIVVSANAHWMHPQFFAYYPSANSYPSIMGDMLAGAMASVGINWESSPACAELELGIVDWLAKMLGLDESFLNYGPGEGGGMIIGTASEGTLTALLCARKEVCQEMGEQIVPKLVGYCSDQAHSSVERAALLGGVQMRKLKTFHNNLFGLTGKDFETAVNEDIANGLKPFFLCACIGTTSSCAIDEVKELIKICKKHKIWIHIDAAYAASAAICPEYKYLLEDVQEVDSFNFNPHKWLLMHFECSVIWFKHVEKAKHCFAPVNGDFTCQKPQTVVPEIKDYQAPLSRKLRALKIWFVIRRFGVSGLQNHIQTTCDLAKHFGELVEKDNKFELFVPVKLGLVCFKLKGSNEINEKLVMLLNEDKRVHLVASKISGTYFLRLAVCSPFTTKNDIELAWAVIKEISEKIFQK